MNIYNNIRYTMYRKSDSFLAPVQAAETPAGEYELYPAFEIGDEIYSRIEVLAERIAAEKSVVIDGYEGILWEKFIGTLVRALESRGRKAAAIPVAGALKSETEIDTLIAPFMGEEDSIFGRMTDLLLIDFFDRTALRQLSPDAEADITLLYGCGAALAEWKGPLVYVDLPKNELQFRMAAGAAFNVGTTRRMDARESYKRCYFIDWPILDAYKGALIPRIDWIVDEQRIDAYTFMSGDALREGLRRMCRSSFRVRPWFAPGVWGGTYLRDHIRGLNREAPNMAWSYELMALENGIMFKHKETLLEVSFSFLMSYGYREVLGHCAEDFKEDFPIRFDFLDTIDGGNLSIQCHPRPEYIRSRFGKPYTQDETYYILRATDDAHVYLGFQEGVQKAPFTAALEESQRTGKALDIKQYVQCFPARKHELFLIPNGTIHASGAGNLVLEISSAPYIFTFKMYDWVRLDIDGRPRPINIEHGLNNVRFERNGKVVPETLISKPNVMERNESYTQEHLPTHPDHFYDVHRYRLHDAHSLTIDTGNRCHVWMVVEGSGVEVETADRRRERYNYLETFIIPAAAGSYTLYNVSGGDLLMVKAFVKDSYKL